MKKNPTNYFILSKYSGNSDQKKRMSNLGSSFIQVLNLQNKIKRIMNESAKNTEQYYEYHKIRCFSYYDQAHNNLL